MSHIRYINKWVIDDDVKSRTRYPHISHGMYKRLRWWNRLWKEPIEDNNEFTFEL